MQQQHRLNAYFTDLDGMRGILAVTVMLLHLGLTSFVARLTHHVVPTQLWTLCVDFFFILSGFVLYFSIEHRRPSLSAYAIKRLRRLAPVFLIGTILMVLTTPDRWLLRTIVANLAMVQSPLRIESIDHPSWSIPFELLLPALLLPTIGWLATSGRAVTMLLVAIAMAGAAVFAVMLARGHDIQAGRAFFGLALGMLLGRLRQQIEPGRDRPMLVLALFAGAVLAMALAVRLPVFALAFPAISAACIFLGAQTRTILSTAPFQALGRWSYSIYLLHVPVLTIVGATVRSADGSLLLKALVVVITLVSAALMYRFVEAPLTRGARPRAQTAP